MTDKELYDHILNNRLDAISETMASKQAEYATEQSPYHNFDTAGEADGITPEQALWGMFLKHYVSVRDMVKGGNTTPYLVHEKIGDCINYMILLEGLLMRRVNNGTT